jgi:hypothetical protein
MSQPILAVGPRPLPADGTVVIWTDTGSGPGHERKVSVNRLTLAPIDDGHGPCGYYLLHPVGHWPA